MANRFNKKPHGLPQALVGVRGRWHGTPATDSGLYSDARTAGLVALARSRPKVRRRGAAPARKPASRRVIFLPRAQTLQWHTHPHARAVRGCAAAGRLQFCTATDTRTHTTVAEASYTLRLGLRRAARACSAAACRPPYAGLLNIRSVCVPARPVAAAAEKTSALPANSEKLPVPLQPKQTLR